MSFPAELQDRIRQEFGPGHFREDDYSFLQPGGNDHLVQFLFKNFPDEYWDLDEWSRHHLLLIDIAGDQNLQFNLDDDGRFAVLASEPGGGRKPVHAIIDLRDEFLAIVYYFGDIRRCTRLNQQLIQCQTFHPCFIDSDMLFRMVDVFEKVIGINYSFEQSPTLFLQPVIMNGELRGDLVHHVFQDYNEYFTNYLNLCAISGFLTDGAQGSITLHEDGSVRTDSCRLSSFIEIVSYVLDMLLKKYQTLSRDFVMEWSEHHDARVLELTGNPVELELPFSIERMEGLVKFLTHGNKELPFLGTAERITRKQWSIKSTEIQSTEQIEFEVSDRLIRVYLKHRRAIPLYDKIEHYLRHQVCANLENWNI